MWTKPGPVSLVVDTAANIGSTTSISTDGGYTGREYHLLQIGSFKVLEFVTPIPDFRDYFKNYSEIKQHLQIEYDFFGS